MQAVSQEALSQNCCELEITLLTDLNAVQNRRMFIFGRASCERVYKTWHTAYSMHVWSRLLEINSVSNEAIVLLEAKQLVISGKENNYVTCFVRQTSHLISNFLSFCLCFFTTSINCGVCTCRISTNLVYNESG